MVSVDVAAGMGLVRSPVQSLMTAARSVPSTAALAATPSRAVPSMQLPATQMMRGSAMPGSQMLRGAMPTEGRQISSPVARTSSIDVVKFQEQQRLNSPRLFSSPTAGLQSNGSSVDVAVGMYGATGRPSSHSGSLQTQPGMLATSASMDSTWRLAHASLIAAQSRSEGEAVFSEPLDGSVAGGARPARARSPGGSSFMTSAAAGNMVSPAQRALSPQGFPLPQAAVGGAPALFMQSGPSSSEPVVLPPRGQLTAVGSRRSSIAGSSPGISTPGQPIMLGEVPQATPTPASVAAEGWTPRTSLNSDPPGQTPGSGPGRMLSQNSMKRGPLANMVVQHGQGTTTLSGLMTSQTSYSVAPPSESPDLLGSALPHRMGFGSSVQTTVSDSMSLSERCRARFNIGESSVPGSASIPGEASIAGSHTLSVGSSSLNALNPRQQRPGSLALALSHGSRSNNPSLNDTPRQSFQPLPRGHHRALGGQAEVFGDVGEGVRRSLRSRPGAAGLNSARATSPGLMNSPKERSPTAGRVRSISPGETPGYMRPRNPQARAGAVTSTASVASSSRGDGRKSPRPGRPYSRPRSRDRSPLGRREGRGNSPRRLSVEDYHHPFADQSGRSVQSSDPWVDMYTHGGAKRWYSDSLRKKPSPNSSRSPSPRGAPSRSPSQVSRCSGSESSASPRLENRLEVALVTERLASRDTVSSRMRRKDVNQHLSELDSFLQCSTTGTDGGGLVMLSGSSMLHNASGSLAGNSTAGPFILGDHDSPTHGYLSQVQADADWLMQLRKDEGPLCGSPSSKARGKSPAGSIAGEDHRRPRFLDKVHRPPGRRLGDDKSDSASNLPIEEDPLRRLPLVPASPQPGSVVTSVYEEADESTDVPEFNVDGISPPPDSAAGAEDELSESAIMGSAICGQSPVGMVPYGSEMASSCADGQWSEEDAAPAA